MKLTKTFNDISRTLLCVLIALFVTLSAGAQTDYISNSRDIDSDRFEDLDGDYGVLIISPNKDLVFTVGDSSTKYNSRMNGRNAKGEYEYYIIVDANSTHRPKVSVSRRGSVYTTEFVEDLKPDFMMAFRVEEIPVPIRIDNQTKPNDAYLSETEAELEFTTPLKDLQVRFSPRLVVSKSTTGASKMDDKLFVTSVVIPVRQLKQAKEALERIQKEHDELESKLTSGSYTGTDAEWSRLDELEAQANEASVAYSDMTRVEVYSEGTNHLLVDISDLAPRVKKCYAVLLLVVEKSVFVSDYSAHMTEAGRLFSLRNYKEARTEYFNALNSKDLEISQRPVINTSISECDSCLYYDKMGALAIVKFNELKKGGVATQREAAKYANAAVECLERLNNYNPDDFYTSRIEKLKAFLADIPLNIKFTIVEWKTLREGNVLPGVEVWAYYGAEPLSSALFTNDRKFRKLVESRSNDFEQVSVSDAQGKAAIVLDRRKLPTGIVFRPVDVKDVKVKYMECNDLMRQAKGTYMEKQFRLKMYRK